jgi:hypothetical protein
VPTKNAEKGLSEYLLVQSRECRNVAYIAISTTSRTISSSKISLQPILERSDGTAFHHLFDVLPDVSSLDSQIKKAEDRCCWLERPRIRGTFFMGDAGGLFNRKQPEHRARMNAETVSGELADGIPFEGTDTVRVISRGK